MSERDPMVMRARAPAPGKGPVGTRTTGAAPRVKSLLDRLGGEPAGDTHVTTIGKGTTTVKAPTVGMPSPVATNVAPTKSVAPVTASGTVRKQQTYTNPASLPYTGGRLTI